MRNRAIALSLMLYAVLWIGGVVTYSLGGSPIGPDGWTAPAFLWTAAVLTLLGLQRSYAIRLAAAGSLAFFAEFIGVSTGFPFSTYAYTGALGFKALGVPVAITMAWIVLLGYVWTGTSKLRSGPLVRAALGALWMTALDLVVDPLAAGPLEYWKWIEGGIYYGIPLTNFLGWFFVSFLLLLFLQRKRSSASLPRAIGVSVLLFFTILATVKGLVAPASIGAGLIFIDLLLFHQDWTETVRSVPSWIRHHKSARSLLLVGMLLTAHSLYAGSDARDLVTTAKGMLRDGNALNDTSLVGKAYRILLSAYEQEPGAETLYFLTQAEYELVRLGVADKPSGLYDRFIDTAIERANTLIRQRGQWSEAHALYSSLLGYRIAHNALNALTAGPKAYSSAEKAVELDPTNPRAWLVRGIAKLNTPSWFGGDKAEAVSSLNRAIDLFAQQGEVDWQVPEWGYLDALVWLGWSYEKTDQPEAAHRSYLKALQVDPRAQWIKKSFLEPLERRLRAR